MFITAGFLNTISSASFSIIQSIQQVSITVASGTLSNTATITGVDTANTILVWGGTTGSDILSREEGDWCSAKLTNGTTVTVARLAAAAVTVTVNVTVLEFAANVIDSIQTGSVAVSGGIKTQSAVITSVVTTDSLCHFQGQTFSVTSATPGPFDAQARIVLADATTVTATRAATSTSNLNAHYVVARFKPGVLNSSTQQIDFATSAEASCVTNISSVDLNKSVFFWGNFSSSATLTNAHPRVALASSTKLTVNKNDTAAATRIAGTVVEFKSTNINSIQRGTVAFVSAGTVASAQASAVATITSASLAKSAAFYTGSVINPNTIATAFGQSFSTISLSSPTELKAETDNKIRATTHTHGYQVVHFI